MTARALGAIAAAALAACFNPTFENTTCGPSGECPPGFSCDPSGGGTGVCRSDGPPIDAPIDAPPGCGDGEVNGEEECDDGNQIDDDGCRNDCTRPASPGCGDGTTVAGEACDDGNQIDDDGCRNDCLSDNTCGNGVLDDHLPLDPMTNPEICLDATTQETRCAEVCDDGNQVSGDGCSANCLSEETCRNGILDPLGNPTATPPNPPEVCDDGNDESCDACRADCQGGAGCGNGLIDACAGEDCDDADLFDGDGCSSACTIEPGWTCTGTPSICTMS